MTLPTCRSSGANLDRRSGVEVGQGLPRFGNEAGGDAATAPEAKPRLQ